MVYTDHGHHIPLSGSEVGSPRYFLRCGGVGLCAKCNRDAVMWAKREELKESNAGL